VPASRVCARRARSRTCWELNVDANDANVTLGQVVDRAIVVARRENVKVHSFELRTHGSPQKRIGFHDEDFTIHARTLFLRQHPGAHEDGCIQLLRQPSSRSNSR